MASVNIERPEFVRETVQASACGVVEKPLTLGEKIWNRGEVRKGLILVGLALIWQVYALQLDNPLLFPTFSSTVVALWEAIVSGGLLGKAWFSIKILLMGYAAGLALATLLTVLAITTTLGNDLLETLTSMFNPLPAIALLPLALSAQVGHAALKPTPAGVSMEASDWMVSASRPSVTKITACRSASAARLPTGIVRRSRCLRDRLTLLGRRADNAARRLSRSPPGLARRTRGVPRTP